MNTSTSPNILLTAFRGTSSEELLRQMQKYRTLILPNDKIRDSENVISCISNNNTDYIISFGQKPNIKDKIHIETCARGREVCLTTDFDADRLKNLFEQAGISAKISQNAGTSFCSRLYLNVLLHLKQHKADTKMIFIHIPFKKNISDFDLFRMGILSAIAGIDESY